MGNWRGGEGRIAEEVRGRDMNWNRDEDLDGGI